MEAKTRLGMVLKHCRASVGLSPHPWGGWAPGRARTGSGACTPREVRGPLLQSGATLDPSFRDICSNQKANTHLNKDLERRHLKGLCGRYWRGYVADTGGTAHGLNSCHWLLGTEETGRHFQKKTLRFPTLPTHDMKLRKQIGLVRILYLDTRV